jgi:hypothetical protein
MLSRTGESRDLQMRGDFRSDNGFVGHSQLKILIITIYSVTLSPIHTVTVYVGLSLLHSLTV